MFDYICRGDQSVGGWRVWCVWTLTSTWVGRSVSTWVMTTPWRTVSLTMEQCSSQTVMNNSSSLLHLTRLLFILSSSRGKYVHCIFQNNFLFCHKFPKNNKIFSSVITIDNWSQDIKIWTSLDILSIFRLLKFRAWNWKLHPEVVLKLWEFSRISQEHWTLVKLRDLSLFRYILGFMLILTKIFE